MNRHEDTTKPSRSSGSWALRRIGMNLLIVLTIGLSVAHAQQGAPRAGQDPYFRPSGRRFGDSLCLQVKFSQGQSHRDLPMLLDLGVHWVRDSVLWADIERVAGKLDPLPASFRQRLGFYREHDIGVVSAIVLDNPGAYPNTPEAPANSANPEAYARYAAHLARALKASGVRFVLEIWNEPHGHLFRKLLGGNWQGKPPSPWLDHYVKLVHETVRAVKAVDPKIQIVTDDDMWIVHYWFLEKGLPKALDGFAFHPYSGKSPAPEITPVAHDTEWTRPFSVVDADRSYRSAVRRLRERGRAKLGKSPTLWATEWGWLVGGDIESGKISEELVAAFLPRAFVLSAAAGVEATCWFSAQDSVDGAMGLTMNSGQMRMAYLAYRTMASELRDFRLVAHALGSEHPTEGVQAYLFRQGSRSKLIVWTVTGESAVEFPAKKSDQVWVRDMVGKEIKPEHASGQNVRLRVSRSPVYIDGLSGQELRLTVSRFERFDATF